MKKLSLQNPKLGDRALSFSGWRCVKSKEPSCCAARVGSVHRFVPLCIILIELCVDVLGTLVHVYMPHVGFQHGRNQSCQSMADQVLHLSRDRHVANITDEQRHVKELLLN